jgi:uncharacterized protein YdhG (YjbR/CyaY superfamily)
MPPRKDVDAWFARYENPMKDVVLRVREIVLGADPRIEECIKWQAPTFTFEGNLASFFPKSKQHASLMFHMGARIPGNHPRLEGGGDTGRVLKIASLEDANRAKSDIERIVQAWCAWRVGEANGASWTRKKRPSTTSTRKKAAKAARLSSGPGPASAVEKAERKAKSKGR